MNPALDGCTCYCHSADGVRHTTYCCGTPTPRPEGEDEQKDAGVVDAKGRPLFWCGATCRYPHQKVEYVVIPFDEDEEVW